MQTRRSLIKRGLGLGAFLWLGKSLPAPEATPIPPAVPSGSLVASGGLCAPLTPIYEMPAHMMDQIRWVPVKDALPSFQAKRSSQP